jgi:hypothetical protein
LLAKAQAEGHDPRVVLRTSNGGALIAMSGW